MELVPTYIIVFAIDAVIGGAFLWLGMKITARVYGMLPGATYCSYFELVLVTLAASVASLVPYVGWVSAFVVLFMMLRKFTSATAGELVMMVVISRLAAVFVLFVLSN